MLIVFFALGMSLVADIKPEKSNRKVHSSIAYEEAAGGYDNIDHDDASAYQTSQASHCPFSNHPSAPIETLASNVEYGPTIRRVSRFSMALLDKSDSRALRHTYTSIQSETASAPKALTDLNRWREMYPQLAAYSDQGQIDCPIFLFDTNLSLTDHYIPSSLLIQFSIDFSQGAHFTEWRSYPRFYEKNGCPVDLTKLYENSWDDLDISQVEGTDNSRLGISFKSEWWVRVFSELMGKKMAMEGSGEPKLIREEEERAARSVQGISVMQEIWATHRVYNHRPQRMAILVWKFNTARRGEVAITSWRRVIAPLPAYEIQSPSPPPERPPMPLGTTLPAASPYFGHSIGQPSIFSGYPAEKSLAVSLSEHSSPSTTPTPGSRSFPSSASASFPSSVSNSDYSLYPSQESFHSQDSAYPPLSSFGSQDPEYTLYEHHEIVEASHASFESHEFADGSQESYEPQEVLYHSQNALYQPTPDHLYEYAYPIIEASATASTCQDFTGGQIHLSYAQNEDSQTSYEAPLAAPQANMIPQHQLIQNLEHFDHHDYLDQVPDDLSVGGGEADEQVDAQPPAEAYELNGLTIDYNGWEEMLRVNRDLECHLSSGVVEGARQVEEEYMSPVGAERLESTQGGVLGEVQGEEGTADGQLEYQ